MIEVISISGNGVDPCTSCGVKAEEFTGIEIKSRVDGKHNTKQRLCPICKGRLVMKLRQLQTQGVDNSTSRVNSSTMRGGRLDDTTKEDDPDPPEEEWDGTAERAAPQETPDEEKGWE